MYQPEGYAVALFFMLVSMICWGSWANTMKLTPGFRFQLFYWDYVLGLILGTLLWGITLGSNGDAGRSFFADIAHADTFHLTMALIGGITFNVANLLLVAAIDIAGLAVAFPVGIGLALVIGAVSGYIIDAQGNPLLLFGGIALVVAAIVCDAVAYRLRESEKKATSIRGVVISLIAGLLMGTFYPFVSKAMKGVDAPGPYATSFFFAIGVALCSLPVNFLLMKKPLDGKGAVSIRDYFRSPAMWHVWGALGGAIWCTGAILNFVASRAHIVGPAVSYSIGQGATMISALWGVFIWREFAHAPPRAKRFLVWMFLLFCAGLSSIALAPIF